KFILWDRESPHSGGPRTTSVPPYCSDRGSRVAGSESLPPLHGIGEPSGFSPLMRFVPQACGSSPLLSTCVALPHVAGVSLLPIPFLVAPVPLARPSWLRPL